MTIEPIEIGVYRDFVRRSLAEDLGWGDATVQAIIPPDATAEGVLLTHSPAVLAGLVFRATMVFTSCSVSALAWLVMPPPRPTAPAVPAEGHVPPTPPSPVEL